MTTVIDSDTKHAQNNMLYAWKCYGMKCNNCYNGIIPQRKLTIQQHKVVVFNPNTFCNCTAQKPYKLYEFENIRKPQLCS